MDRGPQRAYSSRDLRDLPPLRTTYQDSRYDGTDRPYYGRDPLSANSRSPRDPPSSNSRTPYSPRNSPYSAPAQQRPYYYSDSPRSGGPPPRSAGIPSAMKQSGGGGGRRPPTPTFTPSATAVPNIDREDKDGSGYVRFRRRRSREALDEAASLRDPPQRSRTLNDVDPRSRRYSGPPRPSYDDHDPDARYAPPYISSRRYSRPDGYESGPAQSASFRDRRDSRVSPRDYLDQNVRITKSDPRGSAKYRSEPSYESDDSRTSRKSKLRSKLSAKSLFSRKTKDISDDESDPEKYARRPRRRNSTRFADEDPEAYARPSRKSTDDMRRRDRYADDHDSRGDQRSYDDRTRDRKRDRVRPDVNRTSSSLNMLRKIVPDEDQKFTLRGKEYSVNAGTLLNHYERFQPILGPIAGKLIRNVLDRGDKKS